MAPAFEQIELADFATLLVHFPFKCRIDAVHLRRTLRSAREQYRGHDAIAGTWRCHTVDPNRNSIAQQLDDGMKEAVVVGQARLGEPVRVDGPSNTTSALTESGRWLHFPLLGRERE